MASMLLRANKSKFSGMKGLPDLKYFNRDEIKSKVANPIELANAS
jgi:hypothetical protein